MAGNFGAVKNFGDFTMVNYYEYLQSEEWKEKRYQKIRKVGRICERCGRRCKRPHIHHKTYVRLGNEKMSDLEVLCPICHGIEHGFVLKKIKGKWVKEYFDKSPTINKKKAST